MTTAIQDSYEFGICPDCDTAIPNDAVNGSTCVTCGHTFTATAKSLIQRAAVYVQPESEGMRVIICEDDYFIAEGEETGEQYQISYDEVNLETDLIYALVLIN